jgi:hypothetical protein
MRMVYKGITFDDYVHDHDTEENDFYWVEICDECYRKYKDVFGEGRIDNGGSGVACCGVEGCTSNKAGIYVDFRADEVTITED